MTAKRFVLAIDQGTTGSAALLVDHDLRVLGRAKREYPQIYPRPGLGRAQPGGHLAVVDGGVREVVASSGVSPQEIAAIGITNQRETSLCGIASPASRCTTRSSGSAAVPRTL